MFTGLIVIALALLPTLISGVIAWFVAKLASSNKNKRYVIAIALTLVANLALYSDQIYYTYQVKSLCKQNGIQSLDLSGFKGRKVYFKSDLPEPVKGSEHISKWRYIAYDAYSKEPLFEYYHYRLIERPTFLGKLLSPSGIDNRTYMKLPRCDMGDAFLRSSSVKDVAQPIKLRE